MTCSSACLGCSSRGQCSRGVCVCEDGARGIDCAEGSNAAAGLSGRATLGIRIYVYDIPEELATRPYSLKYCRNGQSSIYGAEERFLPMLLKDEAVRTVNPAEANLFYVPTFTTYGPAGNVGCDRARITMIQEYIRTHRPYWSRCHGCDHVFFMTNDRGACGLGPAGKNSIILTHWGLLGPYAPTMTEFEQNDAHYWNKSVLVSRIGSGQWCHSPHKDIVVPPLYLGSRRVAGRTGETNRPFLLSFAGGIWGYNNRLHRGKKNLSYYSQGMRQTIFMRHAHDPHMHIVDHAAPDTIFDRSEFCLAPSGGGFGIRLLKTVALGCVPLIAQPYVLQPFEDLLQYDEFSLRAGHKDVARLPEYLQQQRQFASQMRSRLREIDRAYTWGSDGLAYNFTILSLCLRANDLRKDVVSTNRCSVLSEALSLTGRRWRRHPAWFPPPLRSAMRILTTMRSSPY